MGSNVTKRMFQITKYTRGEGRCVGPAESRKLLIVVLFRTERVFQTVSVCVCVWTSTGKASSFEN
jgi:hypothetical protein